MRLRLLLQKTMKKVSDCVWRTTSSILTITHNFFCQFWNVTFNKIVCQLVLFLFYETPPPDLLSSLLLVLLAGYFGFQVSARQLSAESVRGARFQAPDQLWPANLLGRFQLKMLEFVHCEQVSIKMVHCIAHIKTHNFGMVYSDRTKDLHNVVCS